MSTIGTFAGKLGDCLLQWPVLRQWAHDTKTPLTLWLDQGTLKPLVNLLASQPLVEKVELKPGIEHYRCGGQPWDFGLGTQAHLDHEIIHMGMRDFPQKQITQATAEWVPFHVDPERLANEPSIEVEENGVPGSIICHGTFVSHHSGVPAFWRFLSRIWDELARIGPIYFTGTDEEVKRALEVYPDAQGFYDDGDFLKLARFMKSARAVIGSGSSGVALAGAMKIPCIRVHDQIQGFPKTIWSNLGPNQMNETEIELRRSWPEFKERWLTNSYATVEV